MPVPVRLRFARHGTRHNPFFHLVAIRSTKARDAKPIEKLGEYDPIPKLPATSSLPSSSKVFGQNVHAELQKEKRVEWDVERIKYWLGVGAQPTRSVVKLLEKGGVLTTPHKWQHRWSPDPISSSQLQSSTLTSTSHNSAVGSQSSIDPSIPKAPTAGEMTGFDGKTAS